MMYAIPTLWASNGIDAAIAQGLPLLKAEQPALVQLHTWDVDKAIPTLRESLPQTRFVAGYGVDGVARHVAKGEWSTKRGSDVLRVLYVRALEHGAHAVVWNAEGDWKTAPDTTQRSRILELLRLTWESLAQYKEESAPLHWHTAYDHPASHSSYPWEGWLGEVSPVTLSLAQVYAGAGEKVMAHRGKLQAREVGALDSWRKAIRAGWIDTKNCEWGPYYQLHHVTAYDTIRQALRQTGPVCLWATPTRMDIQGEAALRWLMRVEKVGGLQRWQELNGAKPDGLFGPECARIMGLPVPPVS